jgi:hypothetical protein
MIEEEEKDYDYITSFPEGDEMGFRETGRLLEFLGAIHHRRYIDKGD